MDEKTIVVGKIKTNLLAKVLLISGITLIVLAMVYCWNGFEEDSMFYSRYGGSYLSYLIGCICLSADNTVAVIFYPGILFSLLGIFFNLMMSKCAITITDKRVIGKANFGKRVDLPLNQISSVGQGMISSIAVATSSGSVRFWLLENRDEVFEGLTDLIKSFQIQKTDFSNKETTILQQTSNADELKKFKELLDNGVITQEEFDAKKKQLIGL